MNFSGKTALITGAAVGIGRACAVNFAKHGAKVILLDVNEEKLLDAKNEILSYTKECLAVKCDISDEEDVNRAFTEAKAHFGSIDILVNNAALWRGHATFMEMSIEKWKKFMDVNVFGTVYCTRAVLPDMIEAGYGRIINVASVAGVYGNANMVHYSATKGAVISMTRALAKEVADKGITVNAVSPGSVTSSETNALDDLEATVPSQLAFMNRTGSPMENAHLICFLASDEAAYISGQNIQIDGCRKKQ
jgi:NAD(P)-dependent dehydrogenase (short-subunit alcohol dehydrogenase family)